MPSPTCPRCNVKPIDTTSLLAVTLNLESSHPAEAILRRHNIPTRHGVYDVVERYGKNVANYQAATTDYYKALWKDAIKELHPVIKELKHFFEEAHHA